MLLLRVSNDVLIEIFRYVGFKCGYNIICKSIYSIYRFISKHIYVNVMDNDIPHFALYHENVLNKLIELNNIETLIYRNMDPQLIHIVSNKYIKDIELRFADKMSDDGRYNEGIVSLGKMENLYELKLDNAIMMDFNQISNITILILRNAKSVIYIDSLVHLEILRIDNCHIRSNKRMENIIEINIKNSLDQFIYNDLLQKTPSLKILKINDIGDHTRSTIINNMVDTSYLMMLEDLRILGNNVYFGGISPNIKQLSIMCNDIAPHSLPYLSELKELYIHVNYVDEFEINLDNFPQLEELSTRGNMHIYNARKLLNLKRSIVPEAVFIY